MDTKKDTNMDVYKKSKYLVIREKDGNYRIFHSILGNISKTNKDMIHLLDFLKIERNQEEICNIFGMDKEKIRYILSDLLSKGFIIKDPYEESTENPEFFKKCTRFNHIVLRFYLTERCNLNCRYCFEDKDKKLHGKNLDLETAIKGIDSFLDYYKKMDSKPEEVRIYFFGGEPLLNWKIVPEIVKEVEKKVIPLFKKARMGITTNTVLLNEEISKFLFDKDFYVYLSLDGIKEFHDKYRVYANGKGTFDDVEKGINNLIKVSNKTFIKNNVGITSTIGPLSFDGVDKLLDYILAKGIKNISINKIGVCGGITSDTYNNMHIPDKDFFESAIEWYEKAEKIGIHVGGMWGEIRDRLMNGTLRFCNAVGREFGIGPEGYVYPCPFLFGNHKEAIARILDDKTEYNESNKEEWCNRFADKISECKKCDLLGICSGGCAGMALFDKGSILKPYGCEGARYFSDYFIWRLPK